MSDIFFAPVSTSQVPKRILALLGHVPRAPAPPAGILPDKSLAPEAPGYFEMLADAAVHSPHPLLTEPEQAPSVCLG